MDFVTVIVPVRNEGRAIESTLRSLLGQDYPSDRYEVIVADGASTDDTVPIVRGLQAEYANLKLVYNPARFSSAGRNTAVRHARGEIVVVVDGHCQVPHAGYLTNLVAAFVESGADSLGRPQPLETVTPTAFQTAVSAARSSRLGHNPGSDIYTDKPKFVHPGSTAVAYRRSVFESVGLFDQAFDACEDVEFNERVHRGGLSCYFTPALKIGYHPRADFRRAVLSVGPVRSGSGSARGQTPRIADASRVVPPAWIVWVVAGLPLAFVMPWFGWLYAGSLAAYLAVLAGVVVPGVRRVGNAGPGPDSGRVPRHPLRVRVGRPPRVGPTDRPVLTTAT